MSTGLGLAMLSAALPAPAVAATLHVTPGHSIQSAVDAAHPGDTVVVHPGTYREAGRRCPATQGKCAVVVRKNGIGLVGAARKHHPVVLARSGRQAQGIAIARSGSPKCLADRSKRVRGALVKGFTVKGFRSDGVFLFCVDGWRVTRVRAVGNRDYGIFPSHVGKGRLDHSFASGANDTGLYVGQSHDVRMDHNSAKGNLSGLEIENSRAVRADHNRASGNTAGILSFALPGLDVKVNRNNRVDHNVVLANNRKNTCLEPGDTVCKVPPGSGILLVGADRNTVGFNRVNGNETIGIGVASYCVINGASSTNCTKDIEPNSDNDHVRSNTALGNGGNPDPTYAVFASDLGWDTTGRGNCWSGNTYTKSFPSSLPRCAP